MALVTALVTDAALFAAETLVHFSVLRAPYLPSQGLPWVALFSYVPPISGTGAGFGLRRVIAA